MPERSNTSSALAQKLGSVHDVKPGEENGNEIDERFIEYRKERLQDERSKLQTSFKSGRRTSTAPSQAMVQVLQKRAKETAQMHAEATELQAQVLSQGRVQTSTPGMSRTQTRSLRMSFGMDASLELEAALQLFEDGGTTDDLWRPENNALGYVDPQDRDLIGDVISKAEHERVEAELRRYASPVKSSPTVPRTPRLGVGAKKGSRSGQKMETPRAIAPYRAPQAEFLMLAPDWRSRAQPADASTDTGSPSDRAADKTDKELAIHKYF